MRIHLKNLYPGPEQAYAVLDFTGRGYIFDKDIFNNPIMNKMREISKIGTQDIEMMFEICNLFPPNAGHSGKVSLPAHAMTFDTFKKTFYPHLYVVEEEPQSDEERD